MMRLRPLALAGLVLTAAPLLAQDPMGNALGGALSGAVIGGIIDGDDGAATGAIIGAGVGLMRGSSESAAGRQAQRDYEAMVQAQHDAQFAEAQRVEIATLAPPPPPVPTMEVPELPTYHSPMVEKAQRALTAQSYYTGPVDGHDSPATRAAVKRYQEEHGLDPTGKVTPSLVTRLQAEAR